jgi:hypothetical protein
MTIALAATERLPLQNKKADRLFAVNAMSLKRG